MASSEVGSLMERPDTSLELKKLDFGQLKDIFDRNAETGAPIVAKTVITLIDTAEPALTKDELAELSGLAQKALDVVENQAEARADTIERERGEYQKVIKHLEGKLAQA